jgi:PhnB protein
VTSSPPEGYRTLTPRMVVRDVDAATRFLRVVFGATGEVAPGRPAELSVGDTMVLVSGAGEREVFCAFLYVYVDDVEATYERALNEGAVSLEAPMDTPYGDRRAMVRDGSGNVFQIARRLDAGR